MGKTIIVFEDGKVVDTIEEEKWEGVKIKNGRLVADIPSASADAPDAAAFEPALGTEYAHTAAFEPAFGPAYTHAAAFEPAFGQAEVFAHEAAAAFTASAAEAGIPADGHVLAAEKEEPAAAGPEPANAFAVATSAAQQQQQQQQQQQVAQQQAAQQQTSFGLNPADAQAAASQQAGERPSAQYAAASADTAQYPWRGEAAYETDDKDIDDGRRGGVDARKVIAVLLGLVLAAGAGFGGGIAAINTGNVFFYPPAAQQITINPTDRVSTTEAVAAKVVPSVVGITSVGTRTMEAWPFGAYNEPTGGVGTGIIVDESGYILTNSHVVLDGEVDTITVLLPDGREVQGNVLWNERSLDLAIVKVVADGLVAAELGDSDDIKLGTYVAAIGNPMGLDFRSSISQGVVSGLDRTILASSGSSVQDAVRMEGLIQVDAAINVGNSGGPLLNSIGQVIGINTARNQNGEGMGFAIPINTAKPIVDSIKTTGEFHRVYLGVEPVDVSEFLRVYPQSDLGVDSGAYVYRLTPEFPAEAAGIRAQDIIVEVDGKKINTSSELIKHLLRYKSGDTVEVKVVRDKRQLRFNVTLTEDSAE
jgi:S1-C subfamily serine protease